MALFLRPPVLGGNKVFCSNCGKELAEGAKFCSNCGARVVPEADTPAASTAGEGSGSRLDSFPDFDEDRKAEDSKKEEEKTFKPVHYDLDWGDDTPAKPKTDRVSFDWSSVIDEGHRKKTNNIRSPWDTKGLDEDETSPVLGEGFRGNTGPEIPEDEKEKKDDLEERIARDAAEKPRTKDKSRTLNFIEIMKQEKEAQQKEKSGEGSLYRDDTEEGPILPEDEREKTRGNIDMDDDVVSAIRNDRDDMGELDFDSQLRRIREEGRKNSDRVLKHEPPQSFTEEGRAEAAEEQKKELEREKHEKIAEEVEEASSDDDFLFNLDSEEREELDNTEIPEEAEEDLFAGIEIPDSEDEKEEEPEEEPESEEPAAPEEAAAAGDTEETEEAEEPGPVDESDYLDYLDYEPRGRASRTGRVQSHEPEESDYEEFGEDIDLGDDEEDEENNDVMAEYEAALGAISGEDTGKAAEAEDEAETAEAAEAEQPAEEKAEEPAAEAAETAVKEPEAAAEKAVDEAAAPKKEETVSSVDSEIADLQRKLAELLKEKDEEPEEIPRRDRMTAEDLTRDENMVFGGEEEEGSDDDDFLRELGYTSYDSVVEDGKKEEESPEDIYDGNETKPGIQTGTPSSDIAYGTEEPEGEALDLSAYGIENEPVKKTSDSDATVELQAQQPETAGKVPENGHEVTDLDSELAALGFDVLDSTGDEAAESDMVFTSESTDVSDNEDSEGNEAMPIDELESDLFGENYEGEDIEATRKIEKFYTLYRKNEEFQKLLDEEYEKLQAGSADYTLMDDVLSEYDGEPSFAEKVDEAEKKSAETDEKVKEEASEAVKREAEKFGGEKAPEPVKEAEAAGAAAAAAEPVKAAEAPKVTASSDADGKVSAEALAKTQNAPEIVADEEPEKGGGLVVAAVVVAVLLLLLLIVILILNFAPDSAVALKLSEWISNFTSLAAANDGTFLM
jgi:hypothetical protein